MMPRRNSESIEQHEYNNQTNNPPSPYQNPTYNRNSRLFGNMNQAPTVVYHNPHAGFQQTDLSNDPRRYGMSVGPNAVQGSLMQLDQSQHMGGMITTAPSQYSMPYRAPEHPQFQTPGTAASVYVSADGQRISQMGPGGIQMTTAANHPHYAYTMGVEMQQDQLQQPPPGTATQGGLVSQAEREEELLLQLLIARRNRTQQTGMAANDSLADELMRLRQNRGFTSPTFPGGTTMNQSVMDSSIGGMQRQFLPELNGRIDRNPTRLVDARTQDMLDVSQRGEKRLGYDVVKFGPMEPMYTSQGDEDVVAPPKKQKRAHRKKPADMPRRPLSAYNLFFSEERERILKEIESKEDEPKLDGADDDDDDAEHAVEKKKDQSEAGESEKKKRGEDDDGAGGSKPKAFLRPLIPTEKKRRPHRKTHGKISFQTLARMVGERWKSLSDERRKYYQNLAEEDAKRQKAAMEEYYAKQNIRKKVEEKDAVKEGSDEVKEKESPSSSTTTDRLQGIKDTVA